jgi:hypothetical protein
MAKFSAAGTLFKTGTAGGAPATTIGQVISGDVDFGSLNMIDTTVTTDGTKTNLAGTFEPMSVNVTVVWDPAETGAAAAMTAYLAKTLVSAGLTFPDTGAAVVFSDGYWTNVTAPVAIDDKMQASFTFMGSGARTFTA